MILKGWPSYYADVVDFSNHLYDIACECWKSCPDKEKRFILAASLRCVAIALNKLADDIRKDDDSDET